MIEKLGLAFLHRFDPERAHGLALKALASCLAGGSGPVSTPRLSTKVAGIDLPNPIGAAAGFDKNAAASDKLMRTGFGFCEIGAVTPRPQPGNPKPRLFRLTEDRAAINRFGFNNDGMAAIRTNLLAHRPKGVVGVNLGANKDTLDKADDYVAVLTCFHDLVDFATVNVSSPNTEKLRDLQGRAALDALIAEWQPQILVVGLPLNMDNSDSKMTYKAQEFAAQLQRRYQLPVEFIDELEGADTGDILPMAHPLDMSQRLREDEVTATDANDCTTSLEVTITEPDPIVVTVTTTDETAVNANDGRMLRSLPYYVHQTYPVDPI